jgi:propionyl-CoA synthetase
VARRGPAVGATAAGKFSALRHGSLAAPEAFWLKEAAAIDWTSPPSIAFDGTLGVYGQWFPDALGNMCHNAVDRHVIAGHGHRTAITYDSPVTGHCAEISYATLLSEVTAVAQVIEGLGVRKGDRVLLYMPMVPEALYAMLACARLGAIHTVVFGGFAPPELANRIDDATPSLIVAATCGVEGDRVIRYQPLLDQALARANHRPSACLILERSPAPASLKSGRDHDWRTLVDAARDTGSTVPCVPMRSTDPLYILYTSGTTGRPKGVVRDTGGYMVALAWSMRGVYDVGVGDVFWAASDIGWVVGHSYIVYGPLIAGATTILYEGKPVGTPDASAFPRVIHDHRVNSLFTAPTALRAIRREDPRGEIWNRLAGGRLKGLFLAGERADPATLTWCRDAIGIEAVDHWWQTETGWPIAAIPSGIERLPVKTTSAGVVMPGYDVIIRSPTGEPQGSPRSGAITIALPLPPGCLPTLWNDDARFRREYLEKYPGSYDTMDQGYVDEEGYLYIQGRTDDVINVAGHRLSTSIFEDIIAAHPEVAECAVIGVPDALKGEVPFGFIVARSPDGDPRAIEADLIRLIRTEFGPVAAFHRIAVLRKLPKTRSGKIMRGLMRTVVCGEQWSTPATIDDPSAMDELVQLSATLHE